MTDPLPDDVDPDEVDSYLKARTYVSANLRPHFARLISAEDLVQVDSDLPKNTAGNFTALDVIGEKDRRVFVRITPAEARVLIETLTTALANGTIQP